MEYQKAAEETNGLTDNKIQRYCKIQNKITHKQLQMNIIKEYLRKDIHLQKKDKKY